MHQTYQKLQNTLKPTTRLSKYTSLHPSYKRILCDSRLWQHERRNSNSSRLSFQLAFMKNKTLS